MFVRFHACEEFMAKMLVSVGGAFLQFMVCGWCKTETPVVLCKVGGRVPPRTRWEIHGPCLS